MISICITIKNRSRVTLDDRELQLFPNCVRSIADSIEMAVACELVVTDWASDDWPLHEWIQKLARHVPVRLIGLEGGFSRGRGLNAAAQSARGEALFFTDADSLLCPEVFTIGARAIASGKAFFPVLFSFDSPQHKSGWWRHEGYGNCMVSRALFDQCGGWPEYMTWGKEDDDFVTRVRNVAEVVREEVPGFFHQWHPDDIVWKNRFAERAADIAREIELVGESIKELLQLTPCGSRIILVDEARFGSDPLTNREVFAFTERNGEYAGPPNDDLSAISEFERLWAGGASFMAFTWIAFWWLEYYSGFHDYLRLHFRCILRNDRLIVFDLQSASRKDVSFSNLSLSHNSRIS